MFVNVNDNQPEMDNRQWITGMWVYVVRASLKDCGLTIGNIALPLVHFIYKTAWTLVCDVRDRPHDMTPCHLDSDVTVMITLLSNQYVGLPWPPYLFT